MEDEIQLWANALCWDYSGSAEMILRYMDAKFLPGYAAVSRGRIFGYSFFVYENNKGVIGDLFVSEGGNGDDRQHVERRLLTHVIETLQQSPGVHRIEAQLLAHEAGAALLAYVTEHADDNLYFARTALGAMGYEPAGPYLQQVADTSSGHRRESAERGLLNLENARKTFGE